MANRAAIYARVSTVTGQSLQMQLDALREYAVHRELVVVTELVDHGVSGARDQRPALDELMAVARRRQIDVVLVYKFDRFARSVRHLVNALDEFEALGIEFVSYTESVDMSTPLGRALFSTSPRSPSWSGRSSSSARSRDNGVLVHAVSTSADRGVSSMIARSSSSAAQARAFARSRERSACRGRW